MTFRRSLCGSRGGGDGGGSGGDVLNGFFCHIFLGKMQKEVVIR